MSQFSGCLNEYMASREMSVYLLAKASGVDRSFLHRLTRGKNLPGSQEVVDQLSLGLKLTPEQRERLILTYQISKVGEDVFYRREAVARMLTGITGSGGFRQTAGSLGIPRLPAVCRGEGNVRQLLKAVVDLELEAAEGHLRLLAPTDNDFFMTLVQLAAAARLDIKHILCLDNLPQGDIGNLQALSRVLPAAFSSQRYASYYYYDSAASVFSRMSPFPILLIASRSATLVSADWSAALVIEPGDMYEALSIRFEESLALCRPLVIQSAGMTEHLDGLSQFFNAMPRKSEGCFHIMIPDFCAAPYLTRELVEEYLELGSADRVTLVELIVAHSRTVAGALRCRPAITYTTSDGIDRFLQSGRLSELPPELYRPFAPRSRAYLLKQCLAAAEQGLCKFRIYEPKELPFAKNISICADTGSHKVRINCVHPVQGLVYLDLDESSVTDAIGDYLESLDCAPHILSDVDSIALLRLKLQNFEKK